MPTRRARPAPPPPPSRGAAIAVRESGAGAGDARAAESDEDPFMASLPATVHAANKEGRAKLVQEIHTHAKAHGKSMRTAAKIEGVGFSGSRTAASGRLEEKSRGSTLSFLGASRVFVEP